MSLHSIGLKILSNHKAYDFYVLCGGLACSSSTSIRIKSLYLSTSWLRAAIFLASLERPITNLKAKPVACSNLQAAKYNSEHNIQDYLPYEYRTLEFNISSNYWTCTRSCQKKKGYLHQVEIRIVIMKEGEKAENINTFYVELSGILLLIYL